VEEFAAGLNNPRVIVAAPNGDLFVAESRPGRVQVLRDADGDGKPERTEVFASGLRQPFGIAFFPPGPRPTHVYVANTDSVVRFPYASGDLKARGAEEMIVANVSGGGRLRGGGHWTRDIAFSRDGKKMYVSVGSLSNVSDDESEARRARIFEYTPLGKNERCSPGASATRWASRSIRRPASCTRR
jgi:glucose/arabinose dehydrogenase